MTSSQFFVQHSPRYRIVVLDLKWVSVMLYSTYLLTVWLALVTSWLVMVPSSERGHGYSRPTTLVWVMSSSLVPAAEQLLPGQTWPLQLASHYRSCLAPVHMPPLRGRSGSVLYLLPSLYSRCHLPSAHPQLEQFTQWQTEKSTKDFFL